MFTWPIVLLVVLGISSLVAAGVMSIRLHVVQGNDDSGGEPERVTEVA